MTTKTKPSKTHKCAKVGGMDCPQCEAITVGARVVPLGAGLPITYGYVRELLPARDSDKHSGQRRAYVYWPEIRSGGDWPLWDLAAQKATSFRAAMENRHGELA